MSDMVWLIVTTEQLFPATVQITLANDGAICLITASEGEEEKKSHACRNYTEAQERL